MTDITTRGTMEDMPFTIAFTDKPALWTALAGMVGINIDYSYTGDGTNDKISLQTILFLDDAVAEVLKLNLIGSVVFLRDTEDIVASIGKPSSGF